MQRRLTLIRHAKSSWEDDSLDDRHRPLNARGERDAPMMGQRLVARGARPTLILTSPATRARNTARMIAHELGYPREFLQSEEQLYLATPDGIIEVLARQDDQLRDVVVCGHNPGITQLANRLTGAQIDNVPTCGVVVIDLEIRRWRDADGARGVLVEFDFPRRVPA